MAKIKKNCVWFRTESREGCGIMTDLVCSKRDKCSFYETELQFEKRQKRFLDKHQADASKRVCGKCRKLMNICEFGRNSSAADGIDRYCRECRKQLSRVARKKKNADS